MQTLVMGAGAWGTALAVNASLHRSNVLLWARDPQQVEAMRQRRENARYLPGVALPEALGLSGAPLSPALLDGVDLVVLACPMAGLRASLLALQAAGCGSRPVAWLCKGFEAPQPGSALGLLGHELAQQVAPGLLTGVLSGPSFAQEVAACKPTALVAASRHAQVQSALVKAFHNSHLRVYANGDVAGVEVGGAVKNVLAIATGLCDGLDLGLNARAALVTRGLAEMGRLGQALGAQRDTFMGLSGLGDLVLTATGDLSRNRKVGQLLAQGQGLAQAVDSLGHVAEGVYSARTAVQRARALGLDMPISEAVVALLEGRLLPQAAVQALMEREPKTE